MIDRTFARELVARFGSPLFAYDLEEVAQKARTLFSVLPAGAKIYYSFKANPLPAIADAARRAGCRGEISSLGELQAAQDAGFTQEQLLFGGPGKTDEEIATMLDEDITRFSCESLTDLRRVHTAAEELHNPAQVLLRINPTTAPKAGLAMTGVESQFGFEEELLLRQADEIKALTDRINLIGAHVYFGTQISPDSLVATTRAALETAERISKALGFTCRVVNAGGGFPWPYASAEAGPDLSRLAADYTALLAKSEFARSVELWFESGRYLAAASGTLLATVLDVKESKGGKKYVILDTGINHLGGMSGLGRIPRPFVALTPLADDAAGELETVDVVGPLCSPLDSLGRNLKLPRLQPGDLVAVPNVGAYGLSASLTHFLSRPPAKEITYRGHHVVQSFQLRSGHQKI
jgi:diaminopimelate decarboxylase